MVAGARAMMRYRRTKPGSESPTSGAVQQGANPAAYPSSAGQARSGWAGSSGGGAPSSSAVPQLSNQKPAPVPMFKAGQQPQTASTPQLNSQAALQSGAKKVSYMFKKISVICVNIIISRPPLVALVALV